MLTALSERPDVSLTALVSPEVTLPTGVSRVGLSGRLSWPLAWPEHDARVALSLRRLPCDVFWSPAQSPPLRSPVPWVQTLHDLTPLAFPQPETARGRRHWQRVGRRLRSAAAVVCPSRSSAEQAIDLLGVPAERLHVVPNGVEARFSPGAVPPADPPYLLMVGAWGPHKGFAEATRVISALADAGYPHRLRLVGRQDAWMQDRLDAVVAACGRADRVDVVGYVDDLVTIYRAACAVLVPSRAEGFGLPAAEAMACGTPVVAFDNTSLPEVIGDAGILVPDGDTAAMVTAVRSVIDDASLRARLQKAGPLQAAQFTWPAAADRLASVLLAAAR